MEIVDTLIQLESIYSGQELAALLGVTPATITAWWGGTMPRPKHRATMQRILRGQREAIAAKQAIVNEYTIRKRTALGTIPKVVEEFNKAGIPVCKTTVPDFNNMHYWMNQFSSWNCDCC